MSDKTPYDYGVGGLLKDKHEEWETYARKRWNGRYWVYEVRHAISGPDTPHLLNPWGVNFRIGFDDKAQDLTRGKRKYEFRQVPEAAFQLYVTYLETRNELFYRNAERCLD